MSFCVSKRCAGIAPSATLAIDARAKAMKANGERIIGFAAGEPDFQTPAYICEAGHQAIDQGMTRYTPSSGLLALKQAICAKLKNDNALDYAPNQIIVSNGAKQAIFNACIALLNPGDEVLLPAPCWVSYPEMVQMADGVPVWVHTSRENGFLPSINDLTKHLTPRTKAMIINSPSNPTGCVYPKALLQEIAAFAVAHKIFIISDEIYEQLIYDHMEHVSIASLGEAIKAQTLVINGVSKTYAMTGWRIGYAAGPAEFIQAMDAYQSHATSGPNTIAQVASIEALRNGEAFIRNMREEYDIRRKMMVDQIAKMDGLSCVVPKGAFYVMLDCTKILGRCYQGKRIDDTFALSSLLLDIKKVAVVPGDPFGAPGFCRLSYAVSREDIRDGLSAIEDFIKQLEPSRDLAFSINPS